jgi:hypothetical protein
MAQIWQRQLLQQRIAVEDHCPEENTPRAENHWNHSGDSEESLRFCERIRRAVWLSKLSAIELGVQSGCARRAELKAESEGRDQSNLIDESLRVSS